MNTTFAEGQENPIIIAKTCGCKERKNRQKVTYAFSDYFHNLCMDKKYIIQAEIETCEKLLKYTKNLSERSQLKRKLQNSRLHLI
jgi:hypothetical protein